MDKILVGMEESAGAIIQRCSVNKFLNLPVLQSLFNEVSGLETCSFIEKRL